MSILITTLFSIACIGMLVGFVVTAVLGHRLSAQQKRERVSLLRRAMTAYFSPVHLLRLDIWTSTSDRVLVRVARGALVIAVVALSLLWALMIGVERFSLGSAALIRSSWSAG